MALAVANKGHFQGAVAVSTAVTATMSGAPTSGNLLIAIVSAASIAIGGTLNTAGGWQQFPLSGSAGNSQVAFYKTATTGESTSQSPYTTPSAGATTWAMEIWEISGFTGNGTIANVIGAVAAHATSATQSITAGSGGTASGSGNLIVYGAFVPTSTTVNTAPSGLTSDNQDTTTLSTYFGHETAVGSGSSPAESTVFNASAAGGAILIWVQATATSVQPTQMQTSVGSLTSGSSVSETFYNAPVQGNALIAICKGWGNFAFGTTQSGWTLASQSTASNPVVAIYWKVAGASESKTQTPTLSPASTEQVACTIYEVTGFSGTFSSAYVIGASTSHVASGAGISFAAGAAGSATFSGNLLLGGYAQNNLSNFTLSVPSGWTTDVATTTTKSYADGHKTGVGSGNSPSSSFSSGDSTDASAAGIIFLASAIVQALTSSDTAVTIGDSPAFTPSYSLPYGPPDVRITVLSPSANTVVKLDASGDLAGSWKVQYEQTPGGCGAGSIVFGLRYEEVFAKGYATAMNLVEISTGDDVLEQSISSGATKLYVRSTKPYDPAQGEATQQIYLWDGATLTMRIPVTGIGSDAGGNFITVSTPLAGGGNPSVIPAYTAGVTTIGRRRYAGYIARRERPKQNEPSTTITLQPLAKIFDLTMGSYSIAAASALDIGTAIYNTLGTFGLPGGAGGFNTTISACSAGATTVTVAASAGISAGTYLMLDYGNLNSERVQVQSIVGFVCTLVSATQYAHSGGAACASQPRWPQFLLKSGNFPTLSLTFTGTRTTSSVTSMLADFLGAISTGDVWSLVVDHDRQPKLVKVYTLGTNTYTYALTLFQGIVDFEPLQINVQDQDTTNLANALMVTGATNQATQQPYNAVVVDPNSIAVYDGLQFDAQPASNASLSTDAACASYGAGILAAQSLAQQQATFRVYGVFALAPTFQPQGLLVGDAVRGVNGVTIAQFDQVGVSANNCPDSEWQAGLWTITGFTQVNSVGPAGSNTQQLTANGSATATSPPLYVAAGRPFAPTMYVDASKVTGGTVKVNLLVNGAIVASSVTATNGSAASTLAVPWINLPSGANTVQLQVVASGVTLSGGNLVVSQPMLADGGVVRPYVPNYAAPQIFGLVSSAVTTITSDGDRYQDVTFSPIESDWNSAIAEAGNALAAQIRQNAAPGTSLGQYTVSTSLFPLSFSNASLVVTVPTGVAIFALGSAPLVVGGNTFTLPAMAVSWVWLNPNNTYTVNQNSATVAGAILLGFFQASSTGVTGFTQKASVGVVTLSTFANTTLNPANGYITISDQLVHLSAQQIAMPPAGANAVVDFGFAFMLGSTSVTPVLWLFSDAAAQNGYYAIWDTDGYIRVYRVASGTPSLLGASAAPFTKTTASNNLQIFALFPIAGASTLYLTVTLNGNIAIQAFDTTGAPFTSGYFGPQFSGATATNQIDPNSVIVAVGSSASSSLLKAQGSIPPSSIPGWSISVASPTYSTPGKRLITINSGYVYFTDGSALPWNSSTPVNDSAGANGTWYYGVGLVLATGAVVYYLTQTAPSVTVTQGLFADGVVPLTVGQSLVVTAGNITTVSGGAASQRRFLQ